LSIAASLASFFSARVGLSAELAAAPASIITMAAINNLGVFIGVLLQ
jgi:hypothetical protein